MCPIPAQYSRFHPCCCMSTCATKPSSIIDASRALTKFPPDETSLIFTRASYAKQHIPELVKNDCGNWELTLSIPIPGDIVYPTLTSFAYTINYGTANHHGAAVMKSHILLGEPGSGEIPVGVSTELHAHQDAMVYLFSTLGIKDYDTQGKWSKFAERQQVSLNVRIVKPSCLYLQLQVSEYPTAAMLRSLSIDASATWLEDHECKRLLEKLQEAKISEEEARKMVEEYRLREAQLEHNVAAGKRAGEVTERELREARKATKDAEHNREEEKKHAQEAEDKLREVQMAVKVAETKEVQEKHAKEEVERQLQEALKAAKHAEENAREEKHAREEAECKLREVRGAVERADAKVHAEELAWEELEVELREAQEAAEHAKAKELQEKRVREELEQKLRETQEAVEHAEAKVHKEENAREELERKLQEAWEAIELAEADVREEEHVRKEAVRKLREMREAFEHAEVNERQEEHAPEELEHKLQEAQEIVEHFDADEDGEEHAQKKAGYKLRTTQGAVELAGAKEHVELKYASKQLERILRETREAVKHIETEEYDEEHLQEELEHKFREAREAVKQAEEREHKEKYAKEEAARKLRGARKAVEHAEAKEQGEKRSREVAEKKLREAQKAAKAADAKEQQWISQALGRLPATRRCLNGYGWIQEHAGYRCSGGGHHITWEELHAGRAATKAVADEKQQEKIKRALQNLPAKRQCPNGHAWVHEARGYRCTRGGHYITWEELCAVRDETAVKIADRNEQEKIKDALDRLPAERRCPNGYVWVQKEGGYHCSGGGHHITWDELNLKQEAKAAIVADVKVQEKMKIALEHLPAERMP